MLVDIPEAYTNVPLNSELLAGIRYTDKGIFTGTSRWFPVCNREFNVALFAGLPTLDARGFKYEGKHRTGYGMVDGINQLPALYPELLNSPRKFHLFYELMWQRDSEKNKCDTWEPNDGYVPNYHGNGIAHGPYIKNATGVDTVYFYVIYESLT